MSSSEPAADGPGSSLSVRGDLSGLARRGALSLAGSAISAIAGLGVVAVVTRGSQQRTAGYLFSAISLFIVVEGLCILGTSTGLVYFVARLRALGQHRGLVDLSRVALRPVLAVSVSVGAIGVVCAPWIAGLVVDDASGSAALFVRVLAAFLPVAAAYDVLIAGTQGYHTMRPTVLVEKILRPVTQIALLGLAALLGPVWTLPLAWAAPYLPALVAAAIAYRRLLHRDGVPRAEQSRELLPSTFWRYSAPRGMAAAAQLSLQRLDIILVAAYLGPVPAAVYTAATRFVVLGQLGSQAIALAVQPKFSALLATDDIKTARHVYRISTGWVMAVTWPIHLMVAVFAPVIVQVFGPGYGSGARVIVILAGSMLVATGCGMVTMVLLMAGRTAANLLNVAVALVSNVGLNVILIPRMGIDGAAVAWAVAIVLSNLLPLAQVNRSLGMSPFGRPSLVVGALAVVFLALVPSIGWLLGGGTAALIVFTVLGVVLYCIGIWRFRSTLELTSLLARRAGR